ncbi:hypothetical protein [Pelagibacterium mangrovi]|uniref:hypothetical protein n=1 Tax=Pelagibacterium mangrovi TaxID=3119828 RepID=UPI002FCBF9B5
MKNLTAIALALLLAVPAPALAQQFSEATETDEELIALYDQAGDLCLRNPSRDVEVAVACYSMQIYAMALNERDLCYGREEEANAVMEWHQCEETSFRAPEIDLPEGFN